eukprot:scaffold8.g1463.t1
MRTRGARKRGAVPDDDGRGDERSDAHNHVEAHLDELAQRKEQELLGEGGLLLEEEAVGSGSPLDFPQQPESAGLAEQADGTAAEQVAPTEGEAEAADEAPAPAPARHPAAARGRRAAAAAPASPRTGKAAAKRRRREDDSDESGGRPADPFLAAIKHIPRGQTRTYSEVAEASGRPHASRSVGKALRSLDFDSTRVCWWRVVCQDGGFICSGEYGQLQLERLQEEGARPREVEGVAEWAARRGAHCVGAYVYEAEAFVFFDSRDERLEVSLYGDLNPLRVEAFVDVDQAKERGFVRAADMELEE